MEPNVGQTDKIIRYILGLIIIALGIIYDNWLGALGIIPILTASVSRCPLYYPFKISTKREK